MIYEFIFTIERNPRWAKLPKTSSNEPNDSTGPIAVSTRTHHHLSAQFNSNLPTSSPRRPRKTPQCHQNPAEHPRCTLSARTPRRAAIKSQQRSHDALYVRSLEPSVPRRSAHIRQGDVAETSHQRHRPFNKIIYACEGSAAQAADNSPLFVLWCNDTCSFTWTGHPHYAGHLRVPHVLARRQPVLLQRVRARTCHKGHDCKIKTSSPTAYCDCWEKCKCKALLAGDQDHLANKKYFQYFVFSWA